MYKRQDLEAIDYQISQLALRGVKGTTGTQASFMELFNGDSAKIKAVEADVCAQMGFTKVVPVCGQTYSRKVDYNVLSAVAGLGQSAMKMATDIRLLANFKEKDLDTLLDLMKQAQVNIPLKAVVTPSNKNWVFGDLLAHLSEEHAAFTAAAKEQA